MHCGVGAHEFVSPVPVDLESDVIANGWKLTVASGMPHCSSVSFDPSDSEFAGGASESAVVGRLTTALYVEDCLVKSYSVAVVIHIGDGGLARSLVGIM